MTIAKELTFDTDARTLLAGLKRELSLKSDWSRAYVQDGVSFYETKEHPFLHVGLRTESKTHKVTEALIDLLLSSVENVAYTGEAAVALAKILDPSITSGVLSNFLGDVFREHGKEFKSGKLSCRLDIVKDQSFVLVIKPV
jgi:hypothetical protein